MAEQHERRNVGEIELEGGQPSRNSGQTGLELEEHRIDIVETWNRLVKNAEEVRSQNQRIQSQRQWPRIPKVPQILRGTHDFKKFYQPREISVGPYHHGKPHLHPGEMIKPLYAQIFLANSGQHIEALYTKIQSNIEAVKKCYDWSSTNKYDDEALARMMLLDGCFLLQFIRWPGMGKFLKDHQINFVVQDLFLLENQLPFGVLMLIFEEANLSMEEIIKAFITQTGIPDGSTSKIELEEEDEEPSHLLDLLRSALLCRYKRSSKKKVGSRTEQEQEAEKIEESSLLSGGENWGSQLKPKQQDEKKAKWSLSSGGKDGGFCCPWKKGKQRGIRQSFRHIKELKAAGIYVKPSRTRSLTDISFNSYFFYGYLKLPPMVIDDFTKPRFLNIVAYEMCPDGPDDYTVTSYICFLYDLIDQADDVKELRSRHILHNYLGSDEDVAQIFNEIANDLVDYNAYSDVKASIQKHYDKRVNTWIAQGLHDHFRSPWTIMAFIAAVLILFLTGVQAYYALPGNRDDKIYILG